MLRKKQRAPRNHSRRRCRSRLRLRPFPKNDHFELLLLRGLYVHVAEQTKAVRVFREFTGVPLLDAYWIARLFAVGAIDRREYVFL